MNSNKLQLTINELSNETYLIDKEYIEPDFNEKEVSKLNPKDKIDALHDLFSKQKSNLSKGLDKEQKLLRKEKRKQEFELKQNMVS